jgi:uroporphyrinogen decarboxylase
MTPRERIIAALSHKETDKIPVDLGSTESSGITGVLSAVGADAVPLLIEPREWKSWQFEKGVTVEIPKKADLERLLGGDTVMKSKNGTVLSRLPKSGFYFDSVYHPLENARTVEDIDAGEAFLKGFDWPCYWDEDFSDIAKKAKKLYEETQYAIVGNLCVHLLAAGQEIRGFANFMMDLVINKRLAHRLLQKQVEAYMPRIDRYIEAVGPYLQIILVNDDLGTQNGLQIKPKLYREMIKPYHRQLWGYIKEKSGKPLLLHSCGSIYEIIPDLIEIGVDALNPVQVSAKNMDTAKLKKEFGKDLTFWGGGCDSQKTLPYGTPKDVREEVKRRVNDLAPGGGFVFCQVHNIQPDVSLENILAMYEELGSSNLSMF